MRDRGRSLFRIALRLLWHVAPVLFVGAYALFMSTGPAERWIVVIALILAIQGAGLLYRWKWRDSSLPPPKRTLRDALLIPGVIGFSLVFWFTPGGLMAKYAASGAYATVVIGLVLIARRVTDWEWLN